MSFLREYLLIFSDNGEMHALADRNEPPTDHKEKILLEEMSHFRGLSF